MKAAESSHSGPTSRPHLLVVDDEAPIRDVLKSYLETHGYHVTTAATEAEALRLLKLLPVELIILDVLLEDADGLDLMVKVKRHRPLCPVIIITGLGSDDELKRRALEKGAAECVTKSSPMDQLLAVVERTLAVAQSAAAAAQKLPKRRSSRQTQPAASLKLPRAEEASRTQERTGETPLPRAETPAVSADETNKVQSIAGSQEVIAASAGDSKSTLESPSVRISKALAATPDVIARICTVTDEASHVEFGVEVFLKMLAAYHPNSANVVMRAVAICKTLGESLQMPSDQLQNLLWAAALQDIALVHVEKDTVNRWLRSPEKCTKEEIVLIQRHPEQSQHMLHSCPAFKQAGEIIAAHHENWDGSGYPAGLKMEMIPWLSRLLSVVTEYCRRHTPDSKSLKEIEAQANRLYDPQAVQAFAQAVAHSTLPIGEREVVPSALRPGMVLAGEIIDWDGVLILGKGTKLNNSAITRLLHLSQAGQIEPRALVTC